MNHIADNLGAILQRLEGACAAAGRAAGAARLVAVSKTFPATAVAAAAAAGQRDFGESYLQEALPKIEALAAQGLSQAPIWHFIGPLQANKTRGIAAHFDWVHGIERLKIAERLSAQRPQGLAPLRVCVQVNVSGEASKSGCAPAEAAALCRAVAALPSLRLRGLMTIPAAVDPPEAARPAFRQLRELFQAIRAEHHAEEGWEDFDTLSMGMSGDFEVAVREGATLVRVGSAVFGSRGPKVKSEG